MRSIGEMARDSGLSVSALRFYDGAGVLVPAWVDPVSGYRWYGPEQLDDARLLARLRRVAMPLTDVRLVLAGWSGADTALVRKLLEAHLRGLETGLSDARRELSSLRAILDNRENPVIPVHTTTRLTLSAPELAAALDAVRFAVSTDPELPVLGGVLLDIEGEELRVVATDRYRMAVARAGAAGHTGDRVQVVVPTPLVDAMRALLSGEASAELSVDGGSVSLETEGRQAVGRCLDQDFPDYRRLVRLPAGRRVVVDTATLREAVATGPVHGTEVRKQDGVPYDVSLLTAVDGSVTVSAGDGGHGGAEQVAVNRDFLLDALTAAARDALVLEFGGPSAPLAIRRPDAEDEFSLLMPVALDR